MDQSLISLICEGIECIDEMEANPKNFGYLYADGDFLCRTGEGQGVL